MDDVVLDRHLLEVLECPAKECAKESSCRSIVDPEWATLLGWGNRASPILFLSLNPHYSDDARRDHRVPDRTDPLSHVKSLSLNGFGAVRHFAYHKRIMRDVREGLPEDEADEILDDIDLFAFFSEVALCPTKKGSELPSDVIDRCFRQNVRPFIQECGFKVIVALGREASFHVVRLLIAPDQALAIGEERFDRFHGRVFSRDGLYVIPSYHSNARGDWDRDAVARSMLRLHRDQGVPLF